MSSKSHERRLLPLVSVVLLVAVGILGWQMRPMSRGIFPATAPASSLPTPLWASPALASSRVPFPTPRWPVSVGDGSVRFVDVARKAGLHYRWTIPGPRPLDILQTLGNGCAFLDYDNSGHLSVLLIGTDHVALFKGDGHGHFRDVSHAMGLDRQRGHFSGCAVGDYDNDGYDDIYISGYGRGLLLHNDGGKGFSDVTQTAGLKLQPWGTAAAFADIDGDGRLDLFVGGYADYERQKGPSSSNI